MTETDREKHNAESNGRTRFSLKPISYLLADSDDSEPGDKSGGLSGSDDYSEDDWEATSRRKKRKKSVCRSTAPPVQTLKKILAEKTKALKKTASASKAGKPAESVVDTSTELGKPAEPVVDTSTELGKTCDPSVDACLESDDESESVIWISTEPAKPCEPVVDTSEPTLWVDSKPAKTAFVNASSKSTASDDVKPDTVAMPPFKLPKVESVTSVKIEKTDPKIKFETVTSEAAAIDDKARLSELVSKAQTTTTPQKAQPVVLTYGITNTSNASPYLLQRDVSAADPPSSSPSSLSSLCPPSPSPAIVSTPPVAVERAAPSAPASTVASPTVVGASVPAAGVPRIRIRSNLQGSPQFRYALSAAGLRPAPRPVAPTGPRPRMRAPAPRTPQRVRAPRPRTPQTYHRTTTTTSSSPHTPTPSRPRKIASTAALPAAHPRSLCGSPAAGSPRSAPAATTVRTTPTLKDSRTLKNISSSGAVIYSGSNSVTITPRKVAPDRPPVQRKLFKNEIEGIVAVRHENGVLKYVLNLANGTHMPLTDLQVTKLREQNGGRLPPKLKIPVPSDVAAQIEPSYLIED